MIALDNFNFDVFDRYGLPLGMIIFLVWFGLRHLWPWIKHLIDSRYEAAVNDLGVTRDLLVKAMESNIQIGLEISSVVLQMSATQESNQKSLTEMGEKIQTEIEEVRTLLHILLAEIKPPPQE